MNKDGKLLFDLIPCPVCGQQFTVRDVYPEQPGRFAIRHECPGLLGAQIYRSGWNMREVVQKWNKCMEELNKWNR